MRLSDLNSNVLLKEARVASAKTLKASKKTRYRYAYRAIERQSLDGTPKEQEKADEAMTTLLANRLPVKDMMFWALREKEFKELG